MSLRQNSVCNLAALCKTGYLDLNSAQREADMTGTVKKVMRQKGFGFITPDDGSDDVFFHRGSMAPRVQFEDINEGDSVQFQSRKGDKGPVAFDLKLR